MNEIVSTSKAMHVPGLLNWRPEGLARYESLWSILHKLQRLNYVSSLALFRVICHKGYREITTVSVDLLDLQKIDVPRLAGLLGISKAKLALSVVEPYLLPSKSSTLHSASFYLRFCPLCIKKGFHTPLFQLNTVERCPIHNRLLKEQCPRCHATIPYKFRRSKFSNSYGCACGYVFWTKRDAKKWKPGINPTEERLIENYLRWSSRVVAGKDMALRDLPVLPGWYYTDLLISGYWSDLRPIPGWSAGCFKRDAHQMRGQAICGIYLTLIPTESMAAACAWDGEDGASEEEGQAIRRIARVFMPIYKSTRRKLQKLLHDHRACIQVARASSCWSPCNVSATDALCQWGSAFILWQSIWRRSDFRVLNVHLRGSISFFKADINFSIGIIYRVLQAKLPFSGSTQQLFEWVVLRLLALRLIGSFYEYLQLIANPDGAHTPELKGQYNPYFLWVPGTDACLNTIYWWSRPVLRELDRTAVASAHHRQAAKNAQLGQLDAEREMINALCRRKRPDA